MFIMHHFKSILFLLSFLPALLRAAACPPPPHPADDQVQTYIVHVARPDGDEHLAADRLESWHRSFLPNTSLASGVDRLVYSYRDVISGFAARLKPSEAQVMTVKSGILYARPDDAHAVQTTYTTAFLGLSGWNGSWYDTFYGTGVVVGVLDTGISPRHTSFDVGGMPPPPLKWKGGCNLTEAAGFQCNNKIIGAVGFNDGHADSAIDDDGHGTYVASIAAGNFVDNAGILGSATGTASGTAPRAHLAIYKVCYDGGKCRGSDILKAVDQAIADGVDVISLPLGGKPGSAFYDDSAAVGSLAAARNGIPTVAAAGNSGPVPGQLAHEAPWMTVVGASSVDRKIVATVKLGNGVELEGGSAYQPSAMDFDSSTPLPLAFPGMYGDEDAMNCKNGSLDNYDVGRTIVLCVTGATPNVEKGKVVYAAGGVAMILMDGAAEGFTRYTDAHVLPASHLSYLDGRKVKDYIYNAPPGTVPNATIVFNGTQFGYRPSPGVAAFSSRGPAQVNGGVSKPDVLSPGVNVVAAWPSDVGPQPNPFKRATFNVLSGTSAAAAHVAGIMALIKSKHPDWSAAAIQSAVQTSASNVDLDGNPIVDENSGLNASKGAAGAGQVNPGGAMNQGLVFDIDPEDYIGYLCGLGYSNSMVSIMAGKSIDCSGTDDDDDDDGTNLSSRPTPVSSIDASQLNTPSITVELSPDSPSVTVERTLTNAGDTRTTYVAEIAETEEVRIDLSDYELPFSRANEEKSIKITLSLKDPLMAGSQLCGYPVVREIKNPELVFRPRNSTAVGYPVLASVSIEAVLKGLDSGHVACTV